MIAGHYATALVAKQRVPLGHVAFYLAASQLPDLVMTSLASFGLAPAHSHAGPYQPEMMVSHDLVPAVAWIGLAVVLGRALFGAWQPGWVGGALVVVHMATDLLAGYPHNVLGPDTALVGTGMYYSAPTVAVLIEAVFAAAIVGWVWRADRQQGVRRGVGTWLGRGFVFGGGIGSMLLTAASLADFDPVVGFPRGTAMGMLGLYLTQLAILTWTETRPPRES